MGALIRQWERVDSFNAVEGLAARTAAALSRVEDVPRSVLDALDRIMSCNYGGDASAIFEVVRFLRRMEALERFVPEAIEVPRSPRR